MFFCCKSFKAGHFKPLKDWSEAHGWMHCLQLLFKKYFPDILVTATTTPGFLLAPCRRLLMVRRDLGCCRQETRWMVAQF
jgi:hypothetical protein